jgi:hypothetical protein
MKWRPMPLITGIIQTSVPQSLEATAMRTPFDVAGRDQSNISRALSLALL